MKGTARRKSSTKTAEPVREIDLSLLDEVDQRAAHTELSRMRGKIDKLRGCAREMDALTFCKNQDLGGRLGELLAQAAEAKQVATAIEARARALVSTYGVVPVG